MHPILIMAFKDLKILLRDKMGAFFIVGFPVIMGLFFGLMMSGFSSGGRAAMKMAIVDQDQSDVSRSFIEALTDNPNLKVEPDNYDAAMESVRKGTRVGMLVLPEGFGETAGIFWEDPPEMQLGMDPSRSAESGMMQGFIMEAIGALAGDRFNDPNQFKSSIEQSREQVQNDTDVNMIDRQLLLGFFTTVDTMLDSMVELQTEATDESAENPLGNGFQFANIQGLDISRRVEPGSREATIKKINSRWDISFPQAMMWGMMGCVAGFSISVVRETTLGTMTRLKVAPVSRAQILAGKALVCFLTSIMVMGALTLLGVMLPGGMKPNSYGLLVLAAFCVAFCSVGIMMMFSVFGKTEQSVGGVGWAINIVMAMLGGCMIPVMFMPAFMQPLSVISPMKWGILAIEGAIWRDFSLLEMAGPCAILLGVGMTGLLIGTTVLSRRE